MSPLIVEFAGRGRVVVVERTKRSEKGKEVIKTGCRREWLGIHKLDGDTQSGRLPKGVAVGCV